MAVALDEFLMPHTEALLLIDDEQSEVLETDIFLNESVGTDYKVDRPALKIVENFPLLGFCAQAR